MKKRANKINTELVINTSNRGTEIKFIGELPNNGSV